MEVERLMSASGAVREGEVLLRDEQRETFESSYARWWRVLLHNDDIHTFEYVTNCLVKARESLGVDERGSCLQVVQHLSRRKAYSITWEDRPLDLLHLFNQKGYSVRHMTSCTI